MATNIKGFFPHYSTRFIDSSGTRRELSNTDYAAQKATLGEHTVVGNYNTKTGESQWENMGSVLWSLAKDPAAKVESQTSSSSSIDQRRKDQYQQLRPTGEGDMTKQTVKRKTLLGE